MLVTFASRKAWSEHEFIHYSLRHSLGCHLCSTTFSTENDLTEHLHQEHNLPRLHGKPVTAAPLTKSSNAMSATEKKCP